MSLKGSSQCFYVFEAPALCSSLKLPWIDFYGLLRENQYFHLFPTTGPIRGLRRRNLQWSTQADAPSQFRLPAEDVGQPRDAPLGSIQGVGR